MESYESNLLMEDMVDVGGKKYVSTHGHGLHNSHRDTQPSLVIQHVQVFQVHYCVIQLADTGLCLAVALGTETVTPYVERSEVGVGRPMPTAGLPLGNGPLTVDTWPPLQLICMRAQLFISSSSVFEVRLLLLITAIPTFFF